MNVLSLPDEMLASVLKYISLEDLREIRKVSSKIDSVARRYGMDKMIVVGLRISYNENNIELAIEMQRYREEYRLEQPLSTDLLDILKYIFSKIRGFKFLDLENLSKRKLSISNEVGEFLLGNGCRNINELTIDKWDISINFDTMRRIMTKLRPKKLTLLASFTEFEFSDAVIEGISFDRLKFSSDVGATKPLGISLPYLTRLCNLRIPSILKCKINNSTVSDLITLFKGWTKETIHTIHTWNLIISKGTMSVDENKQSLAKLKCFKDCMVIHAYDYDIGRYCIADKLNSTSGNSWRTKIVIAVFP